MEVSLFPKIQDIIKVLDINTIDGTALQAEKYKERSVQIATELFYVLSKISK